MPRSGADNRPAHVEFLTRHNDHIVPGWPVARRRRQSMIGSLLSWISPIAPPGSFPRQRIPGVAKAGLFQSVAGETVPQVVSQQGERPQMNYWLMKSEPSAHSGDQLVKDGKTFWSGVRNHQAAANPEGDEERRSRVLHLNDGLAVVGIARRWGILPRSHRRRGQIRHGRCEADDAGEDAGDAGCDQGDAGN